MWIKKTALCDWCQTEINGITDKVYENEKGTLCEKCEQARLAEIEIYKEEHEAKRIRVAIDREQRRLQKENKSDI